MHLGFLEPSLSVRLGPGRHFAELCGRRLGIVALEGKQMEISPQEDGELVFPFLSLCILYILANMCGSRTGSPSIIWELVRYTGAQAPPRTTESESAFEQNSL